MSRSGTRAFGSTLAIALALALALAVALAGCRAPEPALRVGTLAWPPYDLAYLARQRGDLDSERIELVEFQTPAELVRSFRYGLVDAMFVTSHFALSTAHDMPDSRIVYIVDVSLGGDALLARPGIESAEQLRGARIGVEAAPLGIYMLVRALNLLDLDRDDVEIVHVDTPDQTEAFLSGRVDAVVTYEPTRTMLLANGANQLFGSEQIPFEIIDVLMTRETTLEDRTDDLIGLVEAMNRALTAYRDDPQESSVIMADRREVPVEQFRDAMQSVRLFDIEDNHRLLRADDGPVRRGLLEQCEVMVREGLLVTTPDFEPLIDRRIVEAAHDR